MMKKLLTLFLAAALLLPCLLTGCNFFGKTEGTTPEETTSGETTPEETTPGDVPVTPPVKTMKLTNVTITAGDTPAEVTAVAELTEYLEKRSITVTEEGYPISICLDTSMEDDAYCVEAVIEGDHPGMNIRGGNGRGVLYGVYGFLEKYAGLRSYTPTLEVYPTEGDIIIEEGKMIEYHPVFEMRVNDWYRWAAVDNNPETFSWCVKNGVNMIDGWWTPWSDDLGGAWDYGGLFVHTIGGLTGTGGGTSANPCLTDEDNLNRAIAAVRERLTSRPSTTILSVSQNDTAARCHCVNCSAIDEEEGSPAGTLLRFVNAIADNIAEDYPNVIIDTLAYDYTQTAPKVTKPAANVCIRLCTIHCHFTHPLTDPDCSENAKFCKDLEEWSKICDNIHIWDYTTNFTYYIPTYANLHVLQQNMQFFAEHNVKGMFPQGNRNSPSGEFGELRAYLLARLMMNPYMGEEEYYRLMDEFLAAYYGAGWKNIREYIDLTTELAANGGYKINSDETEGEPICGQGIYAHPFTVITREEYYNFEYRFDNCWAIAEEMAGNRIEYVKRSEMQWRLIKLYLYPNAEEAQKLIDDAKAAGIYWKEGNSNVQSDSDLSKSPYYWKYRG